VIKLWRIDASGALCALVALTTVHAQATSGATAVVASEFINEHAPYRSSHASTIAETAAGDLVAAWFGGTGEGNPDVGIWFARHVKGHWEQAVEIANGLQPDGTRDRSWNPVLLQVPKGPLFLFYKIGPAGHWRGMVKSSIDGGSTGSNFSVGCRVAVHFRTHARA